MGKIFSRPVAKKKPNRDQLRKIQLQDLSFENETHDPAYLVLVLC